jgi:hypothetical protein
MTKQIKSILPWVAVVSALAASILVLAGIPQRRQILADTGATRLAAAAAVEQIISPPPASLDDAGFRRAVEALPGKTYIANVWLFAPDGRIVSSAGNMMPNDGTAAGHASADTRRLLATLPEGALTDEQSTLLLVASAIQSEGEHNDVLRHLVRAIRSPDGALLGWMGVAYDVSPAVTSPNAGWIVLLLAWLFFVGAYWISLPLWVWLDARQRGERAGVWAMFVLIGNLVALMAYVLTRPKNT